MARQVRNKLLQGNCLKLLPSIEPKTIDLVIADLPYNITQANFDKEVINLTELWKHLKRITKPNTAIIFTATMGYAINIINSNPKWFRYELVWEKSNPSGHLNANRQPLRAHELILVFYKNQPTYNPQKIQGHERKTTTRKNSTTEVYGRGWKNTSYDSTERYPRSVLRFPMDTQKSALHPTQKPVQLFEYLIRTYSNQRAIVLDPCCGSGTTGVAAINTKRDYILIEKDKNYHKAAKARLAQCQEPIFL